MLAFSILHKSWLLSLIFSSSGRDKSEGAGCAKNKLRGQTLSGLRGLLGNRLRHWRSGLTDMWRGKARIR
jgi:hypothetical protein